VATPPLTGTTPSTVEPSWKVTLPVVAAGVTAATRVTVSPAVELLGWVVSTVDVTIGPS
jgi:hypothetical protein